MSHDNFVFSHYCFTRGGSSFLPKGGWPSGGPRIFQKSRRFNCFTFFFFFPPPSRPLVFLLMHLVAKWGGGGGGLNRRNTPPPKSAHVHTSYFSHIILSPFFLSRHFLPSLFSSYKETYCIIWAIISLSIYYDRNSWTTNCESCALTPWKNPTKYKATYRLQRGSRADRSTEGEEWNILLRLVSFHNAPYRQSMVRVSSLTC